MIPARYKAALSQYFYDNTKSLVSTLIFTFPGTVYSLKNDHVKGSVGLTMKV